MRVALYARVSTEGQETDNQLGVLREWAESAGHTVTDEYVDVASGARRRERLDDLYAAAQRRRFDIVAFWSLDRLTREGPLPTLLYLQKLTALGIKAYSHQESYLNPDMPFYETITALLADVARWERQRLQERTKAGLERARASGKRLGRHPKGCRCRIHWRSSKKGGAGPDTHAQS